MNRPALRDPIAEIAMCLNSANAALPRGLVAEETRIAFVRQQLNRALDALDQLAPRAPMLTLVGAQGDD